MTKILEEPDRMGRLSATGRASFSGITAGILLGGEQASMTVMEMTVGVGAGAPAHVSTDEDKVFRITEGRLLFLVGDDRITVSPGDTVFVPKAITHSFAALDDASAGMVLVSTPARHDRFFQDMDALPLPHDPADVEAVCKRHGQIIVGPVVAS